LKRFEVSVQEEKLQQRYQQNKFGTKQSLLHLGMQYDKQVVIVLHFTWQGGNNFIFNVRIFCISRRVLVI